MRLDRVRHAMAHAERSAVDDADDGAPTRVPKSGPAMTVGPPPERRSGACCLAGDHRSRRAPRDRHVSPHRTQRDVTADSALVSGPGLTSINAHERVLFHRLVAVVVVSALIGRSPGSRAGVGSVPRSATAADRALITSATPSIDWPTNGRLCAVHLCLPTLSDRGVVGAGCPGVTLVRWEAIGMGNCVTAAFTRLKRGGGSGRGRPAPSQAPSVGHSGVFAAVAMTLVFASAVLIACGGRNHSSAFCRRRLPASRPTTLPCCKAGRSTKGMCSMSLRAGGRRNRPELHPRQAPPRLPDRRLAARLRPQTKDRQASPPPNCTPSSVTNANPLDR